MKSDINITPLIDVLLVLLIIFMLVAPVAPRALDASVPEPARKEGAAPPPGLVLEVRDDGFSLNSAPVWTSRDLDERLRAAFDRRGDRTLFVKAAGELPYHRLIEALDVAYGAGAERVGVLDPAEEGEVGGR